MAVSFVDSGATIKLVISPTYTQAGYPDIPECVRYIEKANLSLKAEGSQVVVFDSQTKFSFLYSDITAPGGGANATATAALIEAFLDTQAATIASIPDGSDVALGSKADSVATTDAGTFSLISLFKRLLNQITLSLFPSSDASTCPNTDVSSSLESSSISKASQGVFYGLIGHNTLSSAQWILVFNSSSVPANGAVTPIAVVRAAANSPFFIDTGRYGISCSNGICWCNSIDSSIFNKTIGAADCFVNLQYK